MKSTVENIIEQRFNEVNDLVSGLLRQISELESDKTKADERNKELRESNALYIHKNKLDTKHIHEILKFRTVPVKLDPEIFLKELQFVEGIINGYLLYDYLYEEFPKEEKVLMFVFNYYSTELKELKLFYELDGRTTDACDFGLKVRLRYLRELTENVIAKMPVKLDEIEGEIKCQ